MRSSSSKSPWGSLLGHTPWGLVVVLQWLTAVAVLRELAPALAEPRHRHASVAALVAAFLLSVACLRDLQRFRSRGDGFYPRSAALPTSAAVEEARWAVPKARCPQKEVQLREVSWPLSPGSPVTSFAPAAAQAHGSILHAEDGARAKWCAACDAWVRLPAAHCHACGRCTRLRSGHSHRLRVCVGADNRRQWCRLVARALLLQLCYVGLAAAHLLPAAEAAPLRSALRAAAGAWGDRQWGLPQLGSAELLPCAPAIVLLGLGAPGCLDLVLCGARQLLFVCLVAAAADSGSGSGSPAQHEHERGGASARHRIDCRQCVLAAGGASGWSAQRAEVLRVRRGADGAERQGLLDS